MNVTNIKEATQSTASKFGAAVKSDTAKRVGKTVAVGAAGAVGLGLAYAVFAKVANVAYNAMS